MNNSTKEWNLEDLKDCQGEEIYFNGMKFLLDEKGYYRCWTKHKGLRLHRLVWEQQNGEIPDGFHVHHKDHNKKNNHISNLEILSITEHGKRHKDQFMEIRIIPELSLEWRKQNYESSKHLMHEKAEVECMVCGEVVMKRKYAKYRSTKCRNKYNNNKAKASL